MAFGDPNGFERFIRECYLGQDQALEMEVVGVGWISAFPNPFNGDDTGVVGGLAGQAGVLSPVALKPPWIPKVYMGLIATANETPPLSLTNVGSFRENRQFRSMLGARFRMVLDPRTGEPVGVKLLGVIVDGGWTPPFDASRFIATKLPQLLPYIKDQPEIKALADSSWHAGTKSMVSAVMTRPHPNTMLSLPPGERLLVDALIRFRAGDVTDGIGVIVGSPKHVPWVWNEFAVTYGGGSVHVYGIASAFPTIWWYVNGNRIKCQPRLDDSSWPLMPWSRTIDTTSLRVFPALNTGASTEGGAAQVPDDRPSGPISTAPFTVGPPSSVASSQWHYVLGDPPLPSPAVPAC